MTPFPRDVHYLHYLQHSFLPKIPADAIKCSRPNPP